MRLALPSVLRTKKVLAVGVATAVAITGLGINAGTAEAAGANCHARVLKVGSSGTCVAFLQVKLETTGVVQANFNSNNYFGPYTKQKVMEFQGKRGLKADGIVGKATWASLGVTSKGSTSVNGGNKRNPSYNPVDDGGPASSSPKPGTVGRSGGPANGGNKGSKPAPSGATAAAKTINKGDSCTVGNQTFTGLVTYTKDAAGVIRVKKLNVATAGYSTEKVSAVVRANGGNVNVTNVKKDKRMSKKGKTSSANFNFGGAPAHPGVHTSPYVKVIVKETGGAFGNSECTMHINLA